MLHLVEFAQAGIFEKEDRPHTLLCPGLYDTALPTEQNHICCIPGYVMLENCQHLDIDTL